MSKSIIQNINKIFDHRIRLGVMSVLMVNDFVDFTTLKDLLDATDGNFSQSYKSFRKS